MKFLRRSILGSTGCQAADSLFDRLHSQECRQCLQESFCAKHCQHVL